jgi:hypothetical protein
LICKSIFNAQIVSKLLCCTDSSKPSYISYRIWMRFASDTPAGVSWHIYMFACWIQSRILAGYVPIFAGYVADPFQCHFSTISICIESHAQPHKMSHRRSHKSSNIIWKVPKYSCGCWWESNIIWKVPKYSYCWWESIPWPYCSQRDPLPLHQLLTFVKVHFVINIY